MISYASLLPYGEVVNGVLELKKSFSLSECKSFAGCTLVEALSAYCGEEYPEIRFLLTVNGQDKPIYESHSYRIGKSGEYTMQQWRVPPAFLPDMTVSVCFDIPEGATLFVKNFATGADNNARGWDGGLRHNAHLGFWGLAPDNTMPALEMAAASGFSSCIVVPKVTKDGVIVCIHDDTINRTARDKNGNAPAEPTYVWDKTYAELSEWEYGSYLNEIYRGVKLPRLSEFFDLCAKSGMSPMFSTHPGLTVEQWQEVKVMLTERGLLKKFHIKSFGADILKTAYSVFGNEIDGYTYDVSSWSDSIVANFVNTGIDPKACRAGIEFTFSRYTEEIAKEILSAGYFASAWDVKRRKFSEYERLIGWGVTEFTEDYHASMGLNY